MKTSKMFCKDCDAMVRCEARTPNHILHLLLSIITGGIWILLWILIAMMPAAWRCSTCGSSRVNYGIAATWRAARKKAQKL